MSSDPSMAPLDSDRISDATASGPVGRRILVFRKTRCTNDLVMKLGEEGEPEGLVVLAEEQTDGRGQFGREWHSANGVGLWMSILLRPKWEASRITDLTPLIALSLAEAIESVTGLSPRIKRPNDIFLGNRKTAGVLIEARTGRHILASVGIGVNVNHARADFPLLLRESATSLAIGLGRLVDRCALAAAILTNINRMYVPESAAPKDLLDRYEALSRPANYVSFPR